MSERRPTADRVRELLEHVVRRARPRRRVAVEEDDEDPRRRSRATTSGLFIGRHGQTIDAVQHLAYKVADARRRPRRPCASIVDAAGYRERREQVLHRQADQAADARSAPGARSRSTR